jgi:hypothetical protein
MFPTSLNGFPLFSSAKPAKVRPLDISHFIAVTPQRQNTHSNVVHKDFFMLSPLIIRSVFNKFSDGVSNKTETLRKSL